MTDTSAIAETDSSSKGASARREVRHACSPTEVLAHADNFDRPIAGEIVEISASGIQLHIRQPLAIGTLATVEMGEMLVLGEVRHCDETANGYFTVGLKTCDVRMPAAGAHGERQQTRNPALDEKSSVTDAVAELKNGHPLKDPKAGVVETFFPPRQARSSGGRVMVVDDNPVNLRLMESMLRTRGFEVSSFPRGRMALKAAAQAPPDLILLDITMPEMNGYEVCAQLKSNEELSGIPVIFLSALNALDDKIQGFRCGAVDYVSKPFQVEEVYARVETHVKLRQLQRALESDNDRLQELVEMQVRKIADAQMETIFAIAKLAEARDDETGKHLDRIQMFSGLLALALNETPRFKNSMERSWIRNIYHASPLHDIGKVAIPDRVLIKPGRLTTDAFTVMKTHAALGARTLRTVHERFPENEFVRMGIDIAQSHHERWDGSGYPEGQAEDQIPLCARIVAVADFYDAVRSRRCYKTAVPHDETCDMVMNGSGSLFDPEIVKVFGGLKDTFRDVWNKMDQGCGLHVDQRLYKAA
jgi:putative two-component system response regulator